MPQKFQMADKSERKRIADELMELYPVEMYDGFQKQKELSEIIKKLEKISPKLTIEIKSAKIAANAEWSDEWDRRSR